MDHDDDESDDEREEVDRITKELEEEERRRLELRDLEIAQKLERELNFRVGSTYNRDEEGEYPDYQLDEDIGFEGHPAAIPHVSSNRNVGERKYVRQDPPKWLSQPIHLKKEAKVKVFDFTNGSLNNELRKTTDSSVNYEFEQMDDPILKYHNVDDLEARIVKKQQKYLKRFEKEEERRIDEAKRNGSIIEERKQSVDSDERSNEIGMNEPLLAVRQDQQAVFVNQAPANNNVNLGQDRHIFLGIVRQGNGTYRFC